MALRAFVAVPKDLREWTQWIDQQSTRIAGDSDSSIVAHEAAADPHPQYQTSAEVDAAVAAHAAASDPHPTYTTTAELSAALTALNLSSGTYTPTRSAESNLDANVTMSEAQYLRVGSTVTVSGRFTADPTAGGSTSFELTLPIASNLGAAEDAAGVAFSGGIAEGAEIIGVAANNTAKVQWTAVDLTAQMWSYSFSYQVI